MKTNFDQAAAVAKALGRKYLREPWWCGVAIEYDESCKHYYVSVRVYSDGTLDLPELMDDVRIEIVHQEVAKPRIPL